MISDLLEMWRARAQSQDIWSPAQAQQGQDRRIFRRVPVRMTLRMDNRVFGNQADGSLMDLSLGGAGLVAAVNWPEGSHVRVIIEDVHFEADGLVVFRHDVSKEHTRQYRYGVKFQNIGFRKLFKLRKILKAHYQGPLAI